MRINLQQFKKIRENADSATLKNDRGHEITLAKKSLRPHLLKTLTTLPLHLAEKGLVEDPNAPAHEFSQQAASDSALQTPPDITDQSDLSGHVGHLIGKYGMVPMVKAFQSILGPQGAVATGARGVGHMMNAAASEVPEFRDNSQPQAATPPPPALSNGPMSVGSATPPMPQAQASAGQPSMFEDPYKMFTSGAQDYMKGVQGEANAQGEMGKNLAPDYASTIATKTGEYNNFKTQTDEINNENQAVWDDMRNDQINPNHYYESLSTPQKISSAIGIILSGIGSGLTGKDNLAIKFLNDQTDRDIDAQKVNLNSKNNLLAANFHRLGNLRDAMAATRIQLDGRMADRISEEAAKSSYPMAQAKAQQLNGMYRSKIAQETQSFAMQRMAMQQLGGIPGVQQQGAPGGQQAQMDPAKKIRLLEISKMISPEESKAATESLDKINGIEKLRSDVEQNAKDLEAKFMAGKLEPGYRSAKIDALSGIMAKLGEGRFNEEASKNQMHAMMPGAFNFPGTREAQANARTQWFDAMRADHESALKKFGIQVPVSVGKFKEGKPVK